MPGFDDGVVDAMAGGAGLIDGVARWAGVAALLLFAAALVGFGLALPGFEHTRFPVSLLGAAGIRNALGFNLLGFVVPGLLAAAAALGMLRRQPAGSNWAVRVGGQMVLLSALAFAALGVFPLDPIDLDGPTSRWHATAWLLWSVAFVAAGALLGAGQWSREGRRGAALMALVAAAVVGLLGFSPPGMLLTPPLAQRAAFLAWLLWLALAAWPRGAVSRAG